MAGEERENVGKSGRRGADIERERKGYHDMRGRFSIRAFLFRLRGTGAADSLHNKSNNIEGRKDDNIIHRLEKRVCFSYDDRANVSERSPKGCTDSRL